MTNHIAAASRKIGFPSATALVISNMVGTGIFTSLGFQLVSIHHCASILLLWTIGFVIALCGALVYGELGAAMPRSGGEYVYLSHIYHPLLGFLSGFISITIGFAAPAALSSMAFGTYCKHVLNLDSPISAGIALLCVLTLLHCFHNRMSASVQVTVTLINVCLMLLFIAAGLYAAPRSAAEFCAPGSAIRADIINPAYAVALVFVTYAYSGWNAAAYIAGELADPQRTLPRALCAGTVIVGVLYVLINCTFLVSAPSEELAGRLEVAFISARHIFGNDGARIVGAIISLLLLASVSSLVFIGPRITTEVARDIKLLGFFSVVTGNGIPVRAILLQFCISLMLIATATFEQALTFVGFTINLCSLLTVAGVVVHRRRYPRIVRPFRIPAYPLPVLLFVVFMLWNLVYLLIERPRESIAGLAIVCLACVLYGSILYRRVRRS